MEKLPGKEGEQRIYSHEECNAMASLISEVIAREYNDGGICGLNVQSNSWEESPRIVFMIQDEEYYPTLVHILMEYMPEDMMMSQTRIYVKRRSL